MKSFKFNVQTLFLDIDKKKNIKFFVIFIVMMYRDC